MNYRGTKRKFQEEYNQQPLRKLLRKIKYLHKVQ